jgi:hypothetical protein
MRAFFEKRLPRVPILLQPLKSGSKPYPNWSFAAKVRGKKKKGALRATPLKVGKFRRLAHMFERLSAISDGTTFRLIFLLRYSNCAADFAS